MTQCQHLTTAIPTEFKVKMLNIDTEEIKEVPRNSKLNYVQYLEWCNRLNKSAHVYHVIYYISVEGLVED